MYAVPEFIVCRLCYLRILYLYPRLARTANISVLLPVYFELHGKQQYFATWMYALYVCTRTTKKNTSHGNEVLPQDTMHTIQRPCYQRGSPCKDPAGNRTTRRPPDHCKDTQTSVVWLCLPFIRSGQNHLARHSERGKKTRQTEEDVGRRHQEMDRPGGCQVLEGSGEQGK